MELLVKLDEGERETPIKMAEAIINRYMDTAELLDTEDALIQEINELSQVVEYIQVFLNHHRLYPGWR